MLAIGGVAEGVAAGGGGTGVGGDLLEAAAANKGLPPDGANVDP